jgi:hypothetical protein
MNNFFYDLNKRLADLASKQDAKQITEETKASAPKSRLAESMDVAEADYSAKKAAAGKDIGKPGKAFGKIAKGAAERYGSKAAGERVAGAVLNKLRAKESVEEAKLQPTPDLMKKVRARLEQLHDEMEPEEAYEQMADELNITTRRLDQLLQDKRFFEGDMEEGNEFSGELAQARASGAKQFRVDGKEYPVQEDDVDDFIKAGGKVQYGKPQKGPRRPGLSFGSKHIGVAGGAGKASQISGRGANTGKSGKPVVAVEADGPMTPKQKSFAKLAPPANKITFADKIAGAKKEVDEMLGDVAAEAIKGAIGKKKEPRSKGTAFDPEVFKSMTSTDPHPRYDVKDTGYSKRYTRKVQDEPTDDVEVSTEPKKKGRPKGPAKGPERVTKGSYKFKSGRPAKVAEVDMDPTDRGEYDREGDMAKEQMHTIMSAAKQLHSMLRDEENLPEWVQKKITLAKEYIDTARDYMAAQHAERGEEQPIAEKSVSKKQQKFMGMVHAAQKGERPASKEVAKVAKGMGKKDAKDFAATKHKDLPEKVKGKKKEEELDEFLDTKVTVSGTQGTNKSSGSSGGAGVSGVSGGSATGGSSSATGGSSNASNDNDQTSSSKAGAAAGKGNTVSEESADDKKKTSKGGYNFGGSVYESLDRKFQQALTEGMNVSVNMSTGQDGNPTKNITISADGEDADRLAELLKMAGLGSLDSSCKTCGSTPCGCNTLDENSPDWPTNTETLDADPNLRTYSGGLNGPKSTKQGTLTGGGLPTMSPSRQVSMEESLKLERNLFNTWKNYKG